MKSVVRFMAATAAAAAFIPATCSAQNSGNQGYLVDADGGVVTSDNTGLCWRDSDWTPVSAAVDCDPISQPVAGTAVPVPTVIAVAPPFFALPVGPTPMPQKLIFSADALFAFNRSELQREGKAMLDDFVGKLKSTTYETVRATGHADRLGSVDYNRALSMRRAEAVKDYLASKDISVSRIEAIGRGEAEPVTRSGECLGAKSAAIIACLQPDRRVNVELKGTRTMAAAP